MAMVEEVPVELLKMVDEVQIELHEKDHEEEKEDGGDDDHSKKQDVVSNHELVVGEEKKDVVSNHELVVGEEKKSEGEAKEQHEEEENEGDGNDDSTKQDFVLNHEQAEGEKKKKSTKKPKRTSTVTLGKRRVSETDHKQKDDLKKKKKNGDHGGEESVKKLSTFNNLWSKEDEIVMLKGMVRLMKKTGEKPNLEVLLEKIKDSLSVDVTKEQLHNKLRKLKGKYKANVVKGTVQFSNNHDSKRYKLSKKIWDDIDFKTNNGSGMEDSAANKEEVKSRSRGKATISPLQHCNELAASIDEQSWRLLSFFNEVMESAWENSVVPPGLKGRLGKEALGIIRNSKVKDLEHKWKNLHMAEAKVNLELNHLTQEKVKLMLVALGHSEE